MSVLRAVRSTGRSVMPVPVDADGLDVGALESLLARQRDQDAGDPAAPATTRPAATSLSRGGSALLALVRRHGFFVDRGRDLRRPAPRGRRPVSLRAEPRRTSSTATRSRRRSAAACAPAGSRRAARSASGSPPRSEATTSTAPTLTQLAVARYLAEGSHAGQVERARDHYRRGRDALLESIRRVTSARSPATSSRSAADTSGSSSTSTCRRERAVDEAARHGVTYAPGGAMRVDRSRSLAMRLSYSYVEPELMDEGVRRIAAAAHELGARPVRSASVPI